MGRLLHINLETCEMCVFNKWKLSSCGKNDGQVCVEPSLDGENVIITDSDLSYSGGAYPVIPEWCPLPEYKEQETSV